MKRKHALSVALGLAGTGYFLWRALRDVKFADLWRALSGAHWGWLIPMSAIVFLDFFVRAERWRVLLSRARPNAPLGELTRLEAIGLGVNNVVFLRLGEVLRGVLAAKRLQMSAFAAFASIVVERALDVAALLAIFIVASFLAPGFVAPRVRLGAELVLAGSIAALAVLAFAESSVAEGGFLEPLLRRWPKLHGLVSQLSLGAAVLRDPSAAAQAAVWSLVLWSVDAGVYWTGARAMDLGAVIDYPRAVLALSWAGASAAIPASPGGIGTFEDIVKGIIVQFGATPDQALAYALVCHMVMFLIVTVAGLVLLYGTGLSLSELKGEVEKR